MTFISPDISPVDSGIFARFKSALKPYGPHLLAVFAALLIWHLGVKVLYAAIDGPGVATSDRAHRFAIMMVRRLVLFFYFVMIVKIITTLIKGLNRAEGQPLFPPLNRDPIFWLWRFILTVLAVVSFVWLQTNFMSVKTAIPELAPFYLDEAARQWDRALFFGHDPYTLFSWVYDFKPLFHLIDRLYTNWAALIAGTWMYCFVSTSIPRDRRFQYIFSMMLLWFLAGNVFATILSSAGPCYYALFTGDSAAYAPLMERLAALNDVQKVNAFEYHSVLLEMYNTPEGRFGGISAMPSLHVGTSLMLLLMFWKNILLRVLLIAFNILIYIGSIILAWHYAVDGLIAVPLVFICWWLGGKISGYLEARNAPPGQPA